jgi:ArsR family transcriptional regulator
MYKAAQLFKALSEETRLRILVLLTRGELCVCEIEAALDLPQSTVSRHLSLLRQINLVSGRRKGVWMYYQLAEAESDLHKMLLEIIDKQIIELDPARQDLTRLEDFFKRQKEIPCCQQDIQFN